MPKGKQGFQKGHKIWVGRHLSKKHKDKLKSSGYPVIALEIISEKLKKPKSKAHADKLRKINTGRKCDTLRHNLSGTRAYHLLLLLRRVNCKTSKYYQKYEICKRWQGKFGPIDFVKDMGHTPTEYSLLRRYDPDKPYCKSNCYYIN